MQQVLMLLSILAECSFSTLLGYDKEEVSKQKFTRFIRVNNVSPTNSEPKTSLSVVWFFMSLR